MFRISASVSAEGAASGGPPAFHDAVAAPPATTAPPASAARRTRARVQRPSDPFMRSPPCSLGFLGGCELDLLRRRRLAAPDEAAGVPARPAADGLPAGGAQRGRDPLHLALVRRIGGVGVA